ncbi:MAG: lamin tail domain-containing protein, partial [Verrucomicrobiota bacterium]
TGVGIPLADWYLSDDVANLRKWAIPALDVIGAHSWLSYDETTGFHNPLQSGFGLNKAGEQVYLSFLPGTWEDRVADAVRFKGQENGFSLGRYPDGKAFWYRTAWTEGFANAPAAQEPVIQEVMYHPLPTVQNPPDNSADEFIEMYNPTASSIDFWNASGVWRIDGEVDYDFPSNTTLAAGASLVLVSFDPVDTNAMTNFETVYGLTPGAITILGPYSGKLSNRGGRIALERPQAPDKVGEGVSWVIVDEMIYFDQSPWTDLADGVGYSLSRNDSAGAANDWNFWTATVPGPGNPAVLYDGDGDGMGDQWEIEHFGDLTRDGTGNFDNDPATDFDEFIGNTDPLNPGSFLFIVDVDLVVDTEAVITWMSETNRVYTIERANNPLQPWSVIQAGLPSTPPQNTFTDTVNTVTGATYRIRVDLP